MACVAHGERCTRNRSNVRSSKNQLSLGAYKINGLHDSLGTDGSQVVGWRSVGIGVRKMQSFDYINSRLNSQDLSPLERRSLQFEFEFTNHLLKRV